MNVMNTMSYVRVTILFPQPPPSTMPDSPPSSRTLSLLQAPLHISTKWERPSWRRPKHSFRYVPPSGPSPNLTIQKWLRHHSHEDRYVKGDAWELCIESPCFVCPPFISPAIIIPSPWPHKWWRSKRSTTRKRTNAAPTKQCTTNDRTSCGSGRQGPWEPGHRRRSGLEEERLHPLTSPLL